jgi:putative ABC transporter, ATP-binding protein
MKIAKIKWKGHPILGDLELDFTNKNKKGIPYDTIIFAGENGTGKTTVLTSISDFLNGYSIDFEYIEYQIDNEIYRATPKTPESYDGYYDLLLPDKETIIEVNTGKNRNGSSTSNSNIDKDFRNIRFYGCVFSKARADYRTEKIIGTTTKQLDIENKDIDTEDNFTSIKQLLVDIEGEDNAKFKEDSKKSEELGNTPIYWSDFNPSSKMYRFSNAFDNFFENKIKYSKIENNSAGKDILFKKYGRDISIDNLSTGEKQIVFRGAFLLRNLQKMKGGTIFIDEPELSMHPKWERKILQYYKDLFTEDGELKSQLFIATHSEYVLKEALSQNKKNENNLVIVLKDGVGQIKGDRIDSLSLSLPVITSAEVNYHAFDIPSIDYHIELYGTLQNKSHLDTVKKCDEFIKKSDFYDHSIHNKEWKFKETTYETLPSYIRNSIDHPDSPANQGFNEDELRASITLLQKLLTMELDRNITE